LVGLAEIGSRAASGKITTKTAAQRLRKAADWLEQGEQQALDVGEQKAEPSAEVKALFAFWCSKTRRSAAQVKLGPERATMLRKRLSEGFTSAQLRQVIDWAANDSNCQGANKNEMRYDWIENLFRSRGATERNIERATEAGASSTVSGCEDEGTQRKILELKREAAEAMDDDDFERSNRLQNEIDRLRGR